MGQFPNISVIIPVYNCEKYLTHSIESVLMQPNQNIRIVLVDDGSVDSSAQICDRYAAQNDRVHAIHQKNGGVSVARNTGIDYVIAHIPDTEYVAFLDADDSWVADFFTDDTSVAFEYKTDIISFQAALTNVTLTRRCEPPPLKAGLYCGGAGSAWINSKHSFATGFYAVSFLKQYNLRFPQGLRFNEDVIFSMQCKYLAESIYLFKKLLYLYRNNPFSASHTKMNTMDKYDPIIKAYLKLDCSMAQYQTQKRGQLKEGTVMAVVYIMDIFKEHYCRFGSKKMLDQFLERNPQYLELMNSDFVADRKSLAIRWSKIQSHPRWYQMKCYIRGAASGSVRWVYRYVIKIPSIKRFMDKRRYSVVL